MSVWDCVARELALWGDDLPPVRLWLRDDDAFESTQELAQLGQLTKQNNIPLTLAVVPKPATEMLAIWARNNQHILVALHGYSHTNHALLNEKKCELGLHRGSQIVRAASETSEGDMLEIILAQGKLICQVEKTSNSI